MALVDVSRPVVHRPRFLGDYERARQLVRAYGSDTLAYFALRDDKRYFFSSDGEAMIAFATIGNCALASGDPIGHPDSIDLVIGEFLEMCRRRGWCCAFLAARESEADRYADAGLRTFYLGEEAVIDCRAFTLEGKRNKSMRQSVHRVARTYRFEMLTESEAGPELVAQLNALSRRWRGKAPERGFTMALSQAVAGVNPDYQLCVAFDEDGVPGGFLRLVPLFGGEAGMTLDMMRRDPATPNGMIEFLVANTVFALRDQGLVELSMNFAVMGRLFSPDVRLTPGQRLLKAIVSLGNPFFQIQSLHEFNRRFRPTWRPRVIVYQRGLPRIALLYGGIEGFLDLPLIGRLFVRAQFDYSSEDHPPSGGPGRLFDVADEPVEILEPHDVGRVTVDVESRVGDPAGDELRVAGRDEPVLSPVGDDGGYLDPMERLVHARVGGEGLLRVLLPSVDLVGEPEGVGVAGIGVDHVQHLLHVGVAPGDAGGREGEVEELVEVAGPVGGVGETVGLHRRGPAGRGPGEHQRSGLAGVVGGEGQGDLTTG